MKVPSISAMEADKYPSNLIYLVMEDVEMASGMILALTSAGYNLQYFATLHDFKTACQNEIPDIIVIDSTFDGNDTAGFELIIQLKNNSVSCPPIIFISEDNNVKTRLAAARAGAVLFLQKPANIGKLMRMINGLVERNAEQPYRILLIDDDKISLKYYSAVLIDSGMNVHTLRSPLEALDVIPEFRPDVVIVDYHMPECTGPELVQIIRQDDEWAMLTILFLSSEENINRQLKAMDLGGDAFLKKPIDVNYLVKTIRAKAKRARWVNRLNNNLLSAVRENRYYMTTVNQHNIISVADVTGNIISVNDKFCEISGYKREELLGQNHRLIKSGYHPDEFYREMWKTIAGGEIWRGAVCNTNKRGDDYWVESTIVPFLNEQGKPYKYVSVRTDITQLRQSKERLKRSQYYAKIGSWDWNILTGELDWSDNVWPLLGLEKKTTKATYDIFMECVHPDDSEILRNKLYSCKTDNIPCDLEHRVIWPDGSVHWVRQSGDIVPSEDSNSISMLGIIQDIDDKKRAELSLIEAREQAERANHAKTQFFSNMSHELRTPMNAIMGFGQLLMMENDPPLAPSQHENVKEIINAGNHLLTLINEVLDLARIESGQIVLSIKEILLADLVQDSLHLIAPLAQNRGITISKTYNGAHISTKKLLNRKDVIRADPVRLKQVFINFFSNAVKYNCQNGRIIVDFDTSKDNLICISITDTGIGIEAQKQSGLFKAFNRMGAETSTIEGTGIGLVIAKDLVEQMGGRVGVESTSGEGSCFWIELSSVNIPPLLEN